MDRHDPMGGTLTIALPSSSSVALVRAAIAHFRDSVSTDRTDALLSLDGITLSWRRMKGTLTIHSADRKTVLPGAYRTAAPLERTVRSNCERSVFLDACLRFISLDPSGGPTVFEIVSDDVSVRQYRDLDGILRYALDAFVLRITTDPAADRTSFTVYPRQLQLF